MRAIIFLLAFLALGYSYHPISFRNRPEARQALRPSSEYFQQIKERVSREKIDQTIVTVGEEDEETSEHFLVAIDHLEEEVSEDGKNSLIAGRDIRVTLNFDVDETALVLVNGVPVSQGFAALTVKAQIIEVQNGVHVPFDELLAIKILLFVEREKIQTEDGKSVTKVVIQERVVGIESSEVWQATVFQQSFIIREDGKVQRLKVVQVEQAKAELTQKPVCSKPFQGGEGKPHHPHHPPLDQGEEDVSPPYQMIPDSVSSHFQRCVEKVKEFIHKVAEWFHEQTFGVRILVSFGVGVSLGLFIIAFMKCLGACCCSRKCCSSSSCSKKTQKEVYHSNLKAYSIHYTALPQSEKDSKKEQEVIQMA